MCDADDGWKAGRGKRGSRSPKGFLKSMTWVVSRFSCDSLSDHTQETAIANFYKNVSPTDRREARPPPGAAVAYWEDVVTGNMPSADSTPALAERLLCGFFLALAWGGLRFGDAQRCSPFTLNLQRGVTRGCPYATKVTDRGMPFAVCAFGLAGRPPQWG